MSSDCGQRNCNAYKPSGIGGWALLSCSYFPCAFAALLIGAHVWGYYALFVFGLLLEHAGMPSARLLYLIAITTGTFCVAMVLISYIRTVVTPPGYVPSEPWAKQPLVITNKQAAPTNHDHFVSTVTNRRELRYCRRCVQFKPDDAHHCSQCQRCVLRMDHHCPWVNNCVGRDNTKYFILFLCWLGFSCFYLLIQIIVAYSLLPVTFSITSAASHLGLFMLTIGLGIFGIFMSCFGAFHLQMVFSGNSTLGEVMDHQPKSAQFREVFGTPNGGAWYHFLPLQPLNRRPRHRPQPAFNNQHVQHPPAPLSSLPTIGKTLDEAHVNESNSTYFTPRPPIDRPPSVASALVVTTTSAAGTPPLHAPPPPLNGEDGGPRHTVIRIPTLHGSPRDAVGNNNAHVSEEDETEEGEGESYGHGIHKNTAGQQQRRALLQRTRSPAVEGSLQSNHTNNSNNTSYSDGTILGGGALAGGASRRTASSGSAVVYR